MRSWRSRRPRASCAKVTVCSTSVNGKKLDSDPDAAQTMSETVQSTNEVDLVVDRDREVRGHHPDPGRHRRSQGHRHHDEAGLRIPRRREVQRRRRRRAFGRNDVRPRYRRRTDPRSHDRRQTRRRHRRDHSIGYGSTPSGGARQKVAAATENGATLFLSPADNCAEVLTAADQSKIRWRASIPSMTRGPPWSSTPPATLPICRSVPPTVPTTMRKGSSELFVLTHLRTHAGESAQTFAAAAHPRIPWRFC